MSIILRCPKCEKHYESPDEALKKSELQCPECGLKSHSGDFCAMMFCPHCRGKLAVSLSVLQEKRLVCPRCDKAFAPNVSIDLDDDINTNSLFEEDEEDETATFKAGDYFDKYEIISLLGRGGMGEVYLAKHLFLHREVALKIMLSSMAAQNPVFAKRFVREAKLANRISSPNLIPVYDVGIDSKTETLFLAMEYVNGINVNDMVKTRGVFDENTALHIAYKVASALKAMEAANVVHRDIKPSNIMIDVSGEIKLADLGIAKSINHCDGDLTLTQDNMVFGTPNFASPEQCRASHNVDCRADIYSLGATMYHMVTGYPPFRGDTPMNTMLQVLNEPAPSVAASGREFSPGFVLLISDMLQKDPAKRPQNADELQTRISEIFNGDCGLRSKLFYLSKNASKKLRPISGLITDVPSRIYNSIPWKSFRRLTGIAVILLILAAIIFIFAIQGGYFRAKYAELKEKIKSSEPAAVPSENISRQQTSYKAPKINRSRLYKRPAAASVKTPPVKKKTVSVPAQKTAEKKTVSAPENRTAEKKTVPVSEVNVNIDPFEKKFPDTLDGRLARISYILETLTMKNEKSSLRMQQMKFFKDLQQLLVRQKRGRTIAMRQKMSGAYSDSAANAVMRVYRKILSDAAGNTADTADVEKLVSLMKSSSVDPNLELENGSADGKKKHILKVAVADKFFTPKLRNELIEILVSRNTLADCTFHPDEYENLLNKKLIRYGIDPLDSLLMYAVKKRKNDFISFLVSCGADVNQADADGNTVLHWASCFGDSSVICLLLAAGADINKVNKGELQTPLFWAEKFSDDAAVSMLVQAGASADYKDIYGKRASDYSHRRKFADAVRKNDMSKVSDFLDRYPELANNILAEGITPLQFAVNAGSRPLVKALIDANAVISGRTSVCPEQPLQLAFKPFYRKRSGFFNFKKDYANEIFADLIEAGADFNIPYAAGAKISILHYALSQIGDADSSGMAYLDAMFKNIDLKQHAIELVSQLYAASGDQKNNAENRMKILKMLVKDKNIPSLDSVSAIIANAGSSLAVSEDELKFLLEHKADINGKDAMGRTALYRICEKACLSGNSSYLSAYAERILLLIKAGAKVDCSANGRTIADMELPHVIANIPQIRTFLHRRSR